MAHKIERKSPPSGGLESLLDFTAHALLAMGIVSAVVVFLLWQRLESVGILISSFLSCLFFRAFAEIIRLLKKQADLSFSGKITTQKPATYYLCSDCGLKLDDETTCWHCGAKLKTEDDF